MRRLLALPVLAVAGVLAASAPAGASWADSGIGSGTAKSLQLPAGTTPTATASVRDVTVSWPQSTLPGGTPVSGYTVSRYDMAGNPQTVGAGCAGTISALTCTETAVPGGTWKYAVAPKEGTWTGDNGAFSDPVTVAPPALSFSSSTTLTSLPTTLNGTLSGFVPGQTLTFRLDDAATGTLLGGSVTPTPIPAAGTASVTVTIPDGTVDGRHTVYAVGSQGDVAGATILVSVPGAQAFTTTSWSVSDLSSGSATDASDAFTASGGPSLTTTGFQATFDSSRYLAFEPPGPLRAGHSVSSASFNLVFSSTQTDATAAGGCFYFDLRRRSTGAVLGTHGSAGSPVACWSSSGWSPTSTTSLPEVTSTDIANDLQVRVYMTNDAAGGYSLVDRATISLTSSGDTYTLYENQYVDAADGSPTTLAWSLAAAGDGRHLVSSSGWDTSFDAAKYVQLTFPGYVPSGGGVSATFTHSYAGDTSGNTTCWYFAVYSGATLLATHGSSASPVSCNSSTSYVTDSVPLPEVDSVAIANSLVIRLYVRNSDASASNRKSRHDRATVTVAYNG